MGNITHIYPHTELALIRVTSTDAIHDGDQWCANGSRVDRHEFYVSDDASWRQVWRKARQVAGYSGVRGRYITHDIWMPYRTATMLFCEEVI